MKKNNNWIWIVAVIILLFMFFNYDKKEGRTMNIDTLERCNELNELGQNARPNKIYGDCVLITNDMSVCVLGNTDYAGKYGYVSKLKDSPTSAELKDWECFYGNGNIWSTTFGENFNLQKEYFGIKLWMWIVIIGGGILAFSIFKK